MEKDDSSDRKNKSETAKEQEIIPPSRSDGDGESRPAIYADILAQFNQYTDRPDLFLEAVERHDPGFIARINSEARELSTKSRLARFKFGLIQSYTALCVSAGAAIGLLLVAVMLVIYKQSGFWEFVGLAIFFAFIPFTSVHGFAMLLVIGRHAHDQADHAPPVLRNVPRRRHMP